MTLTEIKQVLREEHKHAVASNGNVELTSIQKFQVFEQVLINLLNEGAITDEQFIKWINVYWLH